MDVLGRIKIKCHTPYPISAQENEPRAIQDILVGTSRRRPATAMPTKKLRTPHFFVFIGKSFTDVLEGSAHCVE